MTILIYLIKTILVSGLLCVYYILFLKNRSFHGFNRFFLLFIPVLSFLLPALHFNLPGFWNQTGSRSPIRLLGVGQGKLEEAVTIYAGQHASSSLSWQFILFISSIGISCFLFYRLFKSLLFIYELRKGKPFLKLPEAIIYFVSEKGTPFSFFKSIFWGNEMDLNSPEGKQILRHELFHVKNRHSMDILLMEIFSILYWFNPFIHFIRRELQAIHEYAADYDAARETDGYHYARLLLIKISGTPLSLTNPFFKSQIKRRITMITKNKKNNKALAGRLMILPVIFLFICLFSFKFQNHFRMPVSKQIRVVIDAGHGGVDPGVAFHGIPEKNINLSIARKIQELAKEYNVDVIMTREKDELPGAGDDINWSLKYRAALPRKENADVFISIHADGTDQKNLQYHKSGFDIYVPRNSSKVYEGSVKLGSVLAQYIKPDYTIAPELKQRDKQILVLDNATVPAVLIECGYMDNASDLKYLMDDKNQEKIARDILEGIRKYADQNNATLITNPDDHTFLPDTLTYEDMGKLDISKIDSIHVNKKDNQIFISMRGGKKYIVLVTPELEKKIVAIRANEPADTIGHEIFKKVDVEADYPGGPDAWINYLLKNLKYPKAAIKNEIQGEVMVEFIVKKNGDLADIRAVSGPEVLKEASINIVRNSGKWIPAKQNGLVVDSYHTQPINYKLQ